MTYIHPNAKLESAAILDEISSIANSHVAPNDVTLRRLTNRAKKIMDVDAPGAHTALGAIAALQNNINEAHKHHKIALNLTNEGENALFNYSASLAHMQLYSEAYVMIAKAFDKSRVDLNLLRSTIEFAAFAGLFNEASRYLEIWDKESPNETLPIKISVNMTLELIKKLNLDEYSIQKALKLLHTLPIEENLYEVCISIMPMGCEITYEISLKSSPSDTVRLNEKYAENLLSDDSISDLTKSHFTGMYVSTLDDAYIT